MSDNPPGILPAASCPRCGYDLEGIRATWKDSCPLGGVCSECGYEFEWANLLRKDRQEVRWLYDNARRWWSFRRAVQTLVMTIWPMAFWKRVPLHTRLSPVRWVLWPLVLLVPLHLACLLFTTCFFVTMRRLYGRWPGGRPRSIDLRYAWESYSDLLPIAGWRFARGVGAWEPSLYAYTQASVAAFNLLTLVICLIGASHWSSAKVRRLHFVRAAAYGMAPIILLFVIVAVEWIWRHVPTAVWMSGGRSSWRGFGFPVAPPSWLSAIANGPATPLDELAAWVWLLVWWWAALRIGLRVRQVALLWIAAVVAGSLAMLAVMAAGDVARMLWTL